jgi:hypothetical protein
MKECVRCGETLPNHGPYCLHSNKTTTEYQYIGGVLVPVVKK